MKANHQSLCRGKDKKLVNPVSMTASTAILGEPIRPTATAVSYLYSLKVPNSAIK